MEEGNDWTQLRTDILGPGTPHQCDPVNQEAREQPQRGRTKPRRWRVTEARRIWTRLRFWELLERWLIVFPCRETLNPGRTNPGARLMIIRTCMELSILIQRFNLLAGGWAHSFPRVTLALVFPPFLSDVLPRALALLSTIRFCSHPSRSRLSARPCSLRHIADVDKPVGVPASFPRYPRCRFSPSLTLTSAQTPAFPPACAGSFALYPSYHEVALQLRPRRRPQFRRATPG